MVVAYDEVDTHAFGVGHLFHGLDATVEGDNQFHTCLLSIVDAFYRDTISLAVAVGDVEVDVAVERLQIRIDKCDGRGAVHIVITIYKDALTAPHRVIDTSNGAIHVLHEERIMQLV